MNDTPSNESKNLPNVPEDTQGQIHKIVNNNPQIEKLRRVRHKEVMQGNTFHILMSCPLTGKRFQEML